MVPSPVSSSAWSLDVTLGHYPGPGERSDRNRATVSRSCVFCGGAGLTKEHILPLWVDRLTKQVHGHGKVQHIAGASLGGPLSEEAFDEAKTKYPALRTWQANSSEVTIRRVCSTCNSGWLQRLETSVRPLLTPAILGTERVAIRPREQMLISRWALKTALLLRYVRQPVNPPPEERTTWVMTHEEPPPQAGVWLAAYGGSAHAWVQMSRHNLEPPAGSGVQVFHCELTTFTLGRLLVLVLDVPDADRDVAIGTYEKVFVPFTSKLWPPPGYNVRWPPLLGVDDVSLQKLSEALENGLIQVFVEA
jgi:hypothetical protein